MNDSTNDVDVTITATNDGANTEIGTIVPHTASTGHHTDIPVTNGALDGNTAVIPFIGTIILFRLLGILKILLLRIFQEFLLLGISLEIRL